VNLRDKRPHEAKSDRKDICASRLCFLASVAASYFSGEDWLLSGSSTATLALGWGAANTANNLWLTGRHPKLEMLVPHGSPVVETRNWKCWFLTVLLLSKHKMLVAVEFLWFEFLTFYMAL